MVVVFSLTFRKPLTLSIMKLEHYGIRGDTLKWFCSYLSDRSQFVSINGHNSTKMEISCGVPQGSVLGPLLFLIYINDLPNVSNKIKTYLFADDTNIYLESETISELVQIVCLHAILNSHNGKL